MSKSVIVIVISLLVGFGVGFWWGEKNVGSPSPENGAGTLSDASSDSLSLINGIVEEVGENTFTISTSPPPAFVGEWLEKREVAVTKGIMDLEKVKVGTLVIIETDKDVTESAKFEAVRVRDSKSGEVLAGLP